MSSSDKNRKCANQKDGKACNNLGKHLCSGCGEEIYCSKECQKSHWPDHKVACKSASLNSTQTTSLESLSIKQLKNIMKAKAAAYDAKKKAIVHAQLENIIEKPSLLKFVQDHVKPSEIETLLSQPSNENSTTSSSSSSGRKVKSNKQSNNTPTPTPEQMKEQAKMMRKNPDLVRKANAVFKNMTDEQIRAYADQIDQAASDPQLMKEVLRMSKLSEKDRSKLQHIQEGISGTKPMDAKWIETTVSTLKQSPDIFRTMMKGKGAMMGGLTDEQVNGFIDYMSSLDAMILKMIFNLLIFMASCYNPIVSTYNIVDSYTFGSARYLVLILVGIIVYYCSVITWYCMKWVFGQLFAVYVFVANSFSENSNSPIIKLDSTVTSDTSTMTSNSATNNPNIATPIVVEDQFDF